MALICNDYLCLSFVHKLSFSQSSLKNTIEWAEVKIGKNWDVKWKTYCKLSYLRMSDYLFDYINFTECKNVSDKARLYLLKVIFKLFHKTKLSWYVLIILCRYCRWKGSPDETENVLRETGRDLIHIFIL